MPKKFISIADSAIGKYWDFEGNKGLNPAEIAFKSNKKYRWICPECGKSFPRAANHMHETQLCYDCSIKKRFKTRHENYMKDAVSIADDPIQSKYWDYERNPENPHDVPFRSNGYYYWICPECGKSYKRNASFQYVSSHLCNDCADKARLAAHAQTRLERSEKVSDIPNLLAQWDYEKNDISPDQVLAHAVTNYWWKCPKCGKPDFNTPDKKYESRTCMECAKEIRGKSRRKNEVIRKGSFGDQHPILAKEWHPTLNGNITPYDITSGCGDEFYWICKYQHTFKASPYDRVKKHAGCPTCRKWLRTSFTEQAIAFYLSKMTNVKPNYKQDGYEFDVYLEDFNMAIEYDGMWWHSFDNKKRIEKEKDQYCRNHGIKLLRVKEAEKENKIENGIIYAERRHTDFRWLINSICSILGLLPPSDINIERDTPEILSHVNPVSRDNSIQSKRPDLLEYWDYELNNPISPDMIALKSHFQFSWHCPKCGHKWTNSPLNTSLTKIVCPECRKIAYAENGLNEKGQFVKGRKGK